MIIFDIETGPVSDTELAVMLPEFIPPAHPGEFIPESVRTGNLKDANKIREKIEAARHEHEEAIDQYEKTVEAYRQRHFADFKRQAALSPLTGRVLCIGVMEAGAVYLGMDSEEDILREFWKLFDNGIGEWAGWSIFNFDLPFLVRRSWHHRIHVPEIRVSNSRYWSNRFVDLMERFGLGRWKDNVKLDEAAKFLRVGCKNGHGADFANLWQTDRTAALAYLNNDLELTRGVAARMGLIDEAPASVEVELPF